MQKHIITLLCAAGLAISGQTAAAGLKLRPDAPQRYVVKQGDTLWGISGKYLYSPWQWNRLWGANRSAVRNPHAIYPAKCWCCVMLTAARAWASTKHRPTAKAIFPL